MIDIFFGRATQCVSLYYLKRLHQGEVI